MQSSVLCSRCFELLQKTQRERHLLVAAKRRRILRDLAKCVKCQTQMLPEARNGATEGLTQGPNRPGAGTRGLVEAMLPVM